MSSSSLIDTATVELNNNLARQDLWFHPGEELAVGEMRVTLMGTGWGSVIRPNQKGASIYIELGLPNKGEVLENNNLEREIENKLNNVSTNIETFLFDVGPGCGINYNVMGIPFSRMDKIFLTHMHTDHCSDLGWIYTFGPSADRFTPLQLWGPHCFGVQKPKEPSRKPFSIPNMDEFVMGLRQFTHWHRVSFETCLEVCDGYGLNYTKLDYQQVPSPDPNPDLPKPKLIQPSLEPGVQAYSAPGPGIAYHDSQYGITIKHWPALHIIDGAISYSLEWNGYKVVCSGDTQPNYYITEHGKHADLFIHETAPTATRFAQASNLPEATTQNIVAQSHTPAKALGKILSLAQPKLAVTSHCPIDPEEWQDYVTGVKAYWDGQYQIGEDLMVFTLSKIEKQLPLDPNGKNQTPTVRRGSVFERPWNAVIVQNPEGSGDTISPWLYRTAEIFDDLHPTESTPGDSSSEGSPGHHMPDDAWEYYTIKELEKKRDKIEEEIEERIKMKIIKEKL